MARIDGGLADSFKAHMPEVHWQRIESGGTGRGIPDMNGCWLGREIWIENKKADHWAVEIRPEQVAWIERRARYGGAVFIAVKRAIGGELWLLAPAAGRVLIAPKKGLRDVPANLRLGLWAGGPARWDWTAIRRVLFPVIL